MGHSLLILLSKINFNTRPLVSWKILGKELLAIHNDI